MNHKVTIDLPDELYQEIKEMETLMNQDNLNTSVEQIIVEELTSVYRNCN